MNIEIIACEVEDINDMLLKNMDEHSSYIDSFLEDHIAKSNHYLITLDKFTIGYFSVFDRNLLTQFYLLKDYRNYSQLLMDRIRRYENIQKAFVPTSAEFFLSNAVDYHKKIEFQAYFFQDSGREIKAEKILDDFSCRLAKKDNIAFIEEKTGDFFDQLKERIENNEIYLGVLGEEVVSFGIIEKSKFYSDIASIGMFVLPEHRISGIGRNTILQLKNICYQKKYKPIAGCWYYNHNSKKTLESAGMYSNTRLLGIYF